MLGLLVVIIIVILLVMILPATIRIIRQPHQGVVITLGKYETTLAPGLHFIKPFISSVIRVSTAQQPLDLDKQVVITKDNAEIEVKISLKYHVTDIQDFVFKNEDSVRSMIQDTRASLRGIIGNKMLDEVLNGTQEINRGLFGEISNVTAGYGLNVDRINIDTVKPSVEIQDSMNKLLKAARNRDATVAEAEGYSKSVALKNKADNDAWVNSAQAKAEAVRKTADAEAYRIDAVNLSLNKVGNGYFVSQNIEAFKELAKSNANTVVMPSNAIDSLGQIPAINALLKSEAK